MLEKNGLILLKKASIGMKIFIHGLIDLKVSVASIKAAMHTFNNSELVRQNNLFSEQSSALAKLPLIQEPGCLYLKTRI